MQIIYIITTILILSILVLTHEFGHYLAARAMGVRVLEFSVGMGPALYKRQGKSTLFSIRALPIGGYCSLQGEMDTPEEEGDSEDEAPEDRAEPSCGEAVQAEAPSLPEDGEKPDLNPEEDFTNKKPWQRIVILAAGVTMNFIVGFVIIFVAYLLVGLNPIDAFSRAIPVYLNMFGLIFRSLQMLFTGEAGVKDFAGPIGMVQIVGGLFTEGLIVLMIFTAMLSVNLGIINLLPIPALDGGQIVLVLVEKLKRGSLSWKVRYMLISISYLFLITLMILIAYNDIIRMAVGT